MTVDHLTAAPPQRLATLVVAVLAGGDQAATAAAAGINPADFADAVQLYQAAGLAALEQRSEQDWYDLRVQFPTWEQAESTAAAILGPRLDELQGAGSLTAWWFLRKHPCWRVRMRGADNTAVDQALDELVVSGAIAPLVADPVRAGGRRVRRTNRDAGRA